MSFTALFIALLIERFFDCSHLRQWGWFSKYQQLIMQKLSGQAPYVILAALIVPIILVVALILMMISAVFFGFLKLVISVFVILYCFGPRNLWADTFGCLNAIAEGDAPVAAEKLKASFGLVDVNEPQQLHRQWINAVFMQANCRIFAQVIWFGVVGLVGVVLYRLLSLLEQNSVLSIAARQIKSYMDWVSIRALTLLFALGGNFGRVFPIWRSKVTLGPDANEALLLECGAAALTGASTDGSSEKEEISLIDRSLAIVLVIIAILVFLIP